MQKILSSEALNIVQPTISNYGGPNQDVPFDFMKLHRFSS